MKSPHHLIQSQVVASAWNALSEQEKKEFYRLTTTVYHEYFAGPTPFLLKPDFLGTGSDTLRSAWHAALATHIIEEAARVYDAHYPQHCTSAKYYKFTQFLRSYSVAEGGFRPNKGTYLIVLDRMQRIEPAHFTSPTLEGKVLELATEQTAAVIRDITSGHRLVQEAAAQMIAAYGRPREAYTVEEFIRDYDTASSTFVAGRGTYRLLAGLLPEGKLGESFIAAIDSKQTQALVEIINKGDAHDQAITEGILSLDFGRDD